MSGALLLSVILLAVVLLSSVSRWSEVAVAVPAAAVLIGAGAVSMDQARSEIAHLLPVVLFLATLLLLAAVCDDEGLFGVFGAWLAAGARHRLLGKVFVLAAATTAILSLDATVVLLTPVVLDATRKLGVPSRPHVYATAHLANSASLLLPVSNLTNLLAFTAAGLSFTRFSALMTLPWLGAIAVEYLLLRRVFRRDLAFRAPTGAPVPAQPVPVFVLTVLGLTLTGFAVTSVFGLSPAWAALAGAVVLGGRSLAQRRSTIGGLARSVNLPFLVFVLALGVVVKGVLVNGVETAMSRVLPTGTGMLSLLVIAAIAALLSNLVNNLPATLVLLAPLSGCGPAAILAALIGVNVGPNLTYVGSLSNLLWRRVLHRHGEPTSAGEFTAVGLLTVPAVVVVSITALWAGVRLIGVG